MTPPEIAALQEDIKGLKYKTALLEATLAVLERDFRAHMAGRNQIEMRPAEDVAPTEDDFIDEGGGRWQLRGTDIFVMCDFGTYVVNHGAAYRYAGLNLDRAKGVARSLAKEIRDAGGVP